MIRPIPIAPVNKSIDKSGTTIFNQNQRDGYWLQYNSAEGQKLVWRKRPGFNVFKNLGENGRIDGMHYWRRQNYTFISCNAKMFRLESDTTLTDVTGTASMTTGVRPTFTDLAGTNLYAASSGRIGDFPAASTGAYLTDGDAPTAVRFIGALNQTLIAQRDNSSQFDWSNAGGPTVWDGDFATAEASPGLTKSFKVASDYLYFWGQEDIQLFRDNGVSFVPETQGTIQRGCIAPYSVTEIQGAFFWLDDDREVSVLDGLNVSIISNPELTTYLRSFQTVTDATGDYAKVCGKHLYILSFPTEEKTLVYDISLRMWYEWGYYNTVTAEYERWLGNNVVHADEWKKILAGDRNTGIVYEITETAETDNGNPIRSLIRTDYVERENPNVYKRCKSLTFVFKRADTNTTPMTFQIRHRDEGKTAWSASRTVSLEAQGKTDLRVSVRRFGRYRRRQWEFIFSDPTSSELVEVLEDFDYGR